MDDPYPANTMIVAGATVLILLLLTALISYADEAITAMGEARLRELAEDGNKKAGRLCRITENTRRFHNRLRLVYTFFAIGTAASVFVCFFHPLARWLALDAPWSLGAALLILGIAVTYLLTVFSHRFPRRLALRAPETALPIAGLFLLVYSLFCPLDWLCCGLLSPLLRMVRIDPLSDPDPVTEDVIRELIDAGEETGAIEGAQKDMVNNVFEFDDITAAEIMTPRTDVTAVEAEDAVEEALAKALENGYSRIPVYEDDIDHIIGILYIKDLLPYVGKSVPDTVTVRHLLRDTHFVPDTKKCDELFEEMNEKHLQMAIVVDEYGGVAGIVSMEDLLESIVGNMQDEFDHETEECTQLDEHTFEVDGAMNIGELGEKLDREFPDGDYDTVAGFFMDRLGHIPEAEERASIVYEDITLTIQTMDDRRIERIRIAVQPPADESEGKEKE